MNCYLQHKKCLRWTGSTAVSSLSIPASFLNHSCVPNVFTVPTKEYTKILACRPIKKGEQLFLDYTGDDVSPRDQKRRYLQITYNFTCYCKACTKPWPIQPQYPNVHVRHFSN